MKGVAIQWHVELFGARWQCGSIQMLNMNALMEPVQGSNPPFVTPSLSVALSLQCGCNFVAWPCHHPISTGSTRGACKEHRVLISDRAPSIFVWWCRNAATEVGSIDQRSYLGDWVGKYESQGRLLPLNETSHSLPRSLRCSFRFAVADSWP